MANHGRVKDSGEYFVINPATRKVTVPHVHKAIGTVGDHNSEQITFECPQMIDGHDISQCERRYVTWYNVDGQSGHDELQIKQVEQGTDGMLYLTWTIRNGLTGAKGVIQFSIHFEDTDESGKPSYRWSTTTCKDCEILDSINAVLGAYEAVYVAGNTLVFADYIPVKDGVLSLKTDGIIPKGTKVITENGKHPVGEYAEVDVAVNPVEPEITISEKGVITATANGVSSQLKISSKYDSDYNPNNIKKGVAIFGMEGKYEPEIDESVFENPEITVAENGVITATANGKSSSEKLRMVHDSDFIAGNIKKGVKIFGLEGIYESKLIDVLPLVSGSIIADRYLGAIFDLQVNYSGFFDESNVILENSALVEDNTTFKANFVKGLPFIIKVIRRSSGDEFGLTELVESTGAELIFQAVTETYSRYAIKPTADNFTIRITELQKG